VRYFIDNLDKKDTLEPLGYESEKPKKRKDRDAGGKGGSKGGARDQQRRERRPPEGKVVVVGAGPAGLAAASALKVRGVVVLLFAVGGVAVAVGAVG